MNEAWDDLNKSSSQRQLGSSFFGKVMKVMVFSFRWSGEQE
jgi:hypothetical protein